MGDIVFNCRIRFWDRRRLAAEFTTLARARFRGVHACILAGCGSLGMNLKKPQKKLPSAPSP